MRSHILRGDSDSSGKGWRLLEGIHRNVFVAGLVSLFTDISSEMIVPVLPLFLANTLKAGAASIGVIEGIAEATASLLKFLSGWVADRFGRRKPLMVVGYGLSNVLKPLYALCSTWGQVLAIRFGDRFGKGIRGTPRDALIADSTTPSNRGRAFGFHRAMDTLGAAIGPISAFVILGMAGGDYGAVFRWSTVPGLVAVVLLVAFLREGKPASRSVASPAAGPDGNPLEGRAPGSGHPRPQATGFGRKYVLFAVATMIFALGNSSDAFLILRAQDLGVAAPLVPLAYFTFNAVYSVFSFPAGIVSDRIGRRPVLVGGYLIFGAIYFGFGLARRAWQAWWLFALYGLYYAATEGIQKAYIADLVPEGGRGRAIGAINALTGICTLPASVVAGFMWQNVSPPAPFFLGGALAFIAAAWIVVFRL